MIRRSMAVVLGLAALTLAGCAPAHGFAAPLPSASPTDLQPGLLGAGDLPQGYIRIASVTNADGVVSIGGGDFPGCPALEPMTTERTTAAAVTYSQGITGPYLTHALVRFPSGEAATSMAKLAETATSCRRFTQNLAGVTVTFTVEPRPAPPSLADQAVALRMTGTTNVNLSVNAEIVALRRGDLVVWLNDMSIGTTPPGIAASLAKAATDRCRRTLPGC
ncbi:hypothetical protein KZZ52_25565 [Dactylosporangium sp. AC04546]|uniref:hypothetical protein n=1 Tax=Dactylosporangium sp. AC04546 TaxID=2862460 RepID=UPI001EDFD3F5|nr:hypothetical protein [Dactylosporangium sp. AC04546]WVK88640.1 hypothetical protein KZZ52_25565 [Dactylosporangium sp. AC04546]